MTPHAAAAHPPAPRSGLLYPSVLHDVPFDERLLSERLGLLPSIDLFPRVNTSNSIQPHCSTVSADRQRLLSRLEELGLTEKVVVGDGACQFRSLSDQV
jgi:hypothetical protein